MGALQLINDGTVVPGQRQSIPTPLQFPQTSTNQQLLSKPLHTAVPPLRMIWLFVPKQLTGKAVLK